MFIGRILACPTSVLLERVGMELLVFDPRDCRTESEGSIVGMAEFWGLPVP